MGGGLLQLVAYGAQDVVLTSNPQITFFKTVHRRHTNFAMENIQNNFSGTTTFGRSSTCTISRNGDLVHKVYLKVTLPTIDSLLLASSTNQGPIWGWCRKTGHALIKSVEVEIGGQKIDKHYGEWMDAWSQLTIPTEKKDGYAAMINGYDGDTGYRVEPDDRPVVLYIPLQFWFCTNPGLALPLIALQYHEVKIKVDFRDKKEMLMIQHDGVQTSMGDGSALGWNSNWDDGESREDRGFQKSFELWQGQQNQKGGGSAPQLSLISDNLSAELMVDYIYLDTDERRRFAQVSHEYLITQLQHTGDETFTKTNESIRLNFNHPVKELVWLTVADEAVRWNEWFYYEDIDTEDSMIESGKLMLNGHDRFAERDGSYFSLVQPFQHHTCVPVTGINVYSFALKPEDIQPSGTCNFSRIDNATLKLSKKPETGSSKIKIFATNYNLLRIMSGMGGLAYAN